jgi:hypothetical protein
VWEYVWGVILADGNDVHWHVLTKYRKSVFLRKAVREVTKELFSQYPVIKTSILKNKPKALEYDLRIGFRIVNEDNDRWMLEMTKEDFKL